MAGDGKYPGFLERTKAKLFNDDIRLPNDTGNRDKRLGKPTKADKIRDGYDQLQSVIKGLKDAAPKKR